MTDDIWHSKHNVPNCDNWPVTNVSGFGTVTTQFDIDPANRTPIYNL